MATVYEAGEQLLSEVYLSIPDADRRVIRLAMQNNDARLYGIPCGCAGCEESRQAGHKYCEAPPAWALAAEREGLIERVLAARWYWQLWVDYERAPQSAVEQMVMVEVLSCN